MKKLVVITGADGTGKSTIINGLIKSGYNAVEATIWDAMDSSMFSSKDQIDQYLGNLTANSRVLFLAHALSQAIEKSQNSDAEVVIFNAYYYKYFAAEMAYGADRELINSLAGFFPTPDLVFELCLDPISSFSRKQKVTHYECGMKEKSEENFVNFQVKSYQMWSAFDQKDWIKLDAHNSPEELLNQIKENL